MICTCEHPEPKLVGSRHYCQICFNIIPMTVEEVMKKMNQEYAEKFKNEISQRHYKPHLTPVDHSEIDKELRETTFSEVSSMSEKEVEQAIKIEEKRSYLKWIQDNIGKLTPKQWAVMGAGSLITLIVTFLSGC